MLLKPELRLMQELELEDPEVVVPVQTTAAATLAEPNLVPEGREEPRDTTPDAS